MREGIDDVWTERTRNLIRCDGFVLPCAYPGIDRIAETILLKLFEQTPKAANDLTGRGIWFRSCPGIRASRSWSVL